MAPKNAADLRSDFFVAAAYQSHNSLAKRVWSPDCAAGDEFVPIVEHTADRLKVRSICFDHAGAWASFDRGRNSVVVYSLAVVLPFRRERAHLSDITAAQVRKRERDNGTASYGIVLRRQRGEDIAFSCHSRDDAMHTLHKITKFLNLE